MCKPYNAQTQNRFSGESSLIKHVNILIPHNISNKTSTECLRYHKHKSPWYQYQHTHPAICMLSIMNSHYHWLLCRLQTVHVLAGHEQHVTRMWTDKTNSKSSLDPGSNLWTRQVTNFIIHSKLLYILTFWGNMFKCNNSLHVSAHCNASLPINSWVEIYCLILPLSYIKYRMKLLLMSLCGRL